MHITVNLLPWREKQRTIIQHRFVAIMLILSLMIFIISLLFYIIIAQKINKQHIRNRFLQQHIRQLHSKQKIISQLKRQQQQFSQQINAFNQLANKRIQTLQILITLAKMIPDNMVLTHLSFAKNNILMQGKTQDTENISYFVDNLMQLPWLTQSKIISITHDKKSTVFTNDFILSIQVKTKR
ncbi:MAG: PilN domain-containing protein [Gammaproteobacteria bacterium]|nr:PilN domain-containing protein [Gammaproteobacteria bacterium]